MIRSVVVWLPSGNDVRIRPMYDVPHRWTEPGDPVNATEEFWAFARMRP